MRKITACFLCILLVSGGLYAADEQEISYIPYTEDEFPDFLHDLRRAETLFLGSIPITYAAVSLGCTAAQTLFSAEECSFGARMLMTAGLSTVIVGADYILGILQESED